MLSGIAMAVVLILFPIGVLLSGMVAAVILGSLLKADSEANHEGSELIETNI